MIERDLDVMKNADYMIDMGPGGGVLLLDVCEYFLLVHGGFLLFVNKIISPLDTSLEFVRGVGKSGFVVFYVLCTVFFNML